ERVDAADLVVADLDVGAVLERVLVAGSDLDGLEAALDDELVVVPVRRGPDRVVRLGGHGAAADRRAEVVRAAGVGEALVHADGDRRGEEDGVAAHEPEPAMGGAYHDAQAAGRERGAVHLGGCAFGRGGRRGRHGGPLRSLRLLGHHAHPRPVRVRRLATRGTAGAAVGPGAGVGAGARIAAGARVLTRAGILAGARALAPARVAAGPGVLAGAGVLAAARIGAGGAVAGIVIGIGARIAILAAVGAVGRAGGPIGVVRGYDQRLDRAAGGRGERERENREDRAWHAQTAPCRIRGAGPGAGGRGRPVRTARSQVRLVQEPGRRGAGARLKAWHGLFASRGLAARVAVAGTEAY